MRLSCCQIRTNQRRARPALVPAHTVPKVIHSSEQIKFSRERMSVSTLAVVEFPLAAAKIECAEEIHACENLNFTRIDVSSHV